MIKNLLLSIVFVLYCGANALAADKWNTEEKVLYGTFIGLQALNYGNTNEACEQGTEAMPHMKKIHEKYGSTGLVVYKVVTTAGVGVVAHFLPKPYRRYFLWGGKFRCW